MALNAPRPAARLLQRVLGAARPLTSQRPFSTTPAARFQDGAAAEQEAPWPSAPRATNHFDEVPRWARTPERMKAPFSPHITKDRRNAEWKVNEDPAKLDEALSNLLGKGGERLLPDELKWLAVTHKSFDQGRRGFNDRLAYLGRRIAALEGLHHIVASSPTQGGKFLQPIDNLNRMQPEMLFDMDKMKKLAMDTGIMAVVRWKPRKTTDDLKSSGLQSIMAASIYAIIGAIALQHGGKVASRVLRERVLKKLNPA